MRRTHSSQNQFSHLVQRCVAATSWWFRQAGRPSSRNSACIASNAGSSGSAMCTSETETSMSTEPRVNKLPCCSTPLAMRCWFRKVPLVEPRSLMATEISATEISQWKLETLGSAIWMSLSGLRPIRFTPGLSSIARPGSGGDFNVNTALIYILSACKLSRRLPRLSRVVSVPRRVLAPNRDELPRLGRVRHRAPAVAHQAEAE
jgi:hypothetical protein